MMEAEEDRVLPPRAWQWICIAVYALYIAVMLNRVYDRPSYNWDLLAYVASVADIEHDGMRDMHIATFDELKASLPPELYETGFANPAGPYGQRIANGPKALHQQLPFYQIKWLYVHTLWLGHQLGIPVVKGSQLINVISLAAIAWLLACWRPQRFPLALWLAGGATILTQLMPVWRLFTPDAMATALAFAACYFGVAKARMRLSLGLFAAAITTRPDMLPVALLFFFFWWWQAPRTRSTARFAALCAFVCAMAYLLASYPGYGWKLTFQHAFMGKMTHPADTELLFTWETYRTVLERHVQRLLHRGNPIYLLIAFSTLLGARQLLKSARGTSLLYAGLGLIAGAAFVIKIMLFPMPGLRFHALPVLLAWVACAYIAWEILQTWLAQRKLQAA